MVPRSQATTRTPTARRSTTRSTSTRRCRSSPASSHTCAPSRGTPLSRRPRRSCFETSRRCPHERDRQRRTQMPHRAHRERSSAGRPRRLGHPQLLRPPAGVRRGGRVLRLCHGPPQPTNPRPGRLLAMPEHRFPCLSGGCRGLGMQPRTCTARVWRTRCVPAMTRDAAVSL